MWDRDDLEGGSQALAADKGGHLVEQGPKFIEHRVRWWKGYVGEREKLVNMLLAPTFRSTLACFGASRVRVILSDKIGCASAGSGRR